MCGTPKMVLHHHVEETHQRKCQWPPIYFFHEEIVNGLEPPFLPRGDYHPT